MHRVRSGAGRYPRVFYTERDAQTEGRGGDRPSVRHWRQYRQCHPRAAGRRMQRRGCNRHHGKPAKAGVDLTGVVTMIASQDDVRAVAGAEPVPLNLLPHFRNTVCEADESSSLDLEKRSRTVSVDIGGGEIGVRGGVLGHDQLEHSPVRPRCFGPCGRPCHRLGPGRVDDHRFDVEFEQGGRCHGGIVFADASAQNRLRGGSAWRNPPRSSCEAEPETSRKTARLSFLRCLPGT